MADLRWNRNLAPPLLPPVLVKPPVSGKILVISPHVDDETVGMGGTIQLHVKQGDPVDVLFLTHGGTGDADKRFEPADYIRTRRKEGRKACDLLGVGETHFWDYPDGYQVTEEDLAVIVPRLAERLDRGGYEAVYTPHYFETHTDHHTGAVITVRAAEFLQRPIQVFAYEVWAPLRADFVVDITGVFPGKLAAAACYASQLALNDITLLFKCLNGYRAQIMENKQGQAEAFQRMEPGP